MADKPPVSLLRDKRLLFGLAVMATPFVLIVLKKAVEWSQYDLVLKQFEDASRKRISELFQKDKYKVTSVVSYPHSNECLVDFKRKGFTPDIDCEEYCESIPYESQREYKTCVRECKQSAESAITGSILFDLATERVKESTIPSSCESIWMAEDEDQEEFEAKERKLRKKFREIGCNLSTAWIHPHELAGAGEWEQYPAVCYIHVTGGKVGDVLRVLEEVA